MHRIKAWALLAGGALCVLFGLVSAVSVAFDWEISISGGIDMPQSRLLAGVFVPGGGMLFATGLLALDSPSQPQLGDDGQHKRSSRS